MAVVAYTVEVPTRGVQVITWATMANGDTGEPFIGARYNTKSVQITGTFGAGGSINMEGSNNSGASPAYSILSDPQGNAITKTAAALEAIQEGTYLVRPNVTAGDGTTALTVRMFAMAED